MIRPGSALVAAAATGFFLAVLASAPPSVRASGLAGAAKPLYAVDEPGIVFLNASNMESKVLESDTVWLVEFYSSWCGHCINFAPTFKKLALDVQGWNRVIQVGALDCANDANLGLCRQYEVMGYPTLKFFAPGSPKGFLGDERESHVKKENIIKEDMHNFVRKVSHNETLSRYAEKWTNLDLFEDPELKRLWSHTTSHYKSSPFGLLLLHRKPETFTAIDMLLDASEIAIKTPLLMRRLDLDQASSQLVGQLLGQRAKDIQLPALLSVARDKDYATNVIQENISREELVAVIKEFIWKESKILSGQRQPQDRDDQGASKQPKRTKAPVLNEGEIKRRRYTVHMWDLEQAIHYALAHEASSHKTIAGDTLAALQEFVDVLARTFPARLKLKEFLRKLREFLLEHDDAVLGEDLSNHIELLKGDTSAFREIVADPGIWVGCAGSEPIYGGYPCGLWTLFHTLTVHERNGELQDSKSSPALQAIAGYVEHFFGCRECAQHFGEMVQANPISEVDPGSEAVMWLWNAHNKANIRLSGDLSDDPAFPKEPFPNQQHCSNCYTGRLSGSDFASHFNLNNVQRFLRLLYTDIDMTSVAPDTDSGPDHHPIKSDHHEVMLPDNLKEESHKESLYIQKKEEVNTIPILSPSDTRLSVIVYLLSVVLLFVGYWKFVARRRLGLASKLCPKGRSGSPMYSNPLIGKV